jgi:20S proteasome subunit beta 4
MDYMGSQHQVPFGAHGYGSYFTMSIFDRYYHEDITVEEGIEILKKCIKELQLRFMVHLPAFLCKISDKDGVREVSLGEYGLQPEVYETKTQ